MDKARRDGSPTIPWRIIGWSIPLILLLLPLATGADWTLSDYLLMAAMFAVAGAAIELAVRASGDLAYRLGAGVAVAAAFLLVWVNFAVGFLGSEDNPANLLFFGLVALALGASVLARFRAPAMARVMLATAAGQILVGLAALALGLGSPGGDGVYEAAMGSILFGGLWLASAWLFAHSAPRHSLAR